SKPPRQEFLMRRFYWLSLSLTTVLSFLLVFIPAFLIRPFVAQTQRGLVLSYQMRSLSQTWTLVFLATGILLALPLQNYVRPPFQKFLIGLLLLTLGASAVMARQNHFERSEERRVGKECRSEWSPVPVK